MVKTVKTAPIFDHNHQKTSNRKHDWTPIKYLNVLHHNRTQKQLQFFFLIYCKNITNFLFWILWPFPSKIIMQSFRNFDVCLYEKMKSISNFFLRYYKDLQTCYFAYFENASSCSSVMIVLPCRKIWCPRC